MINAEKWSNAYKGAFLLAVGTTGALGAHLVGIPAGVVIGALLASGTYRLFGGEPGNWRHKYGAVGRVLLGAYIGASFTPQVIEPLRRAILPMALVIAAMVSSGLTLGWLLSRVSGVTLATGLLSSMPGGLPAMAAMAEEVDADAPIVAVIHFTRLLTILVVVPVLVGLITPFSTRGLASSTGPTTTTLSLTALAMALAWFGGQLGARAGVPTGDLIGSLLVVAAANLAGAGLGPLHPTVRYAAQLLIGVSVGAQMSVDSLKKLRHVGLPAAGIITTLIALGLALGWGLYELTPLDLPTALLSGVPGGASTMPLIAQDLGGDTVLVAALHLIRQIAIFVVMPPVLGVLLRRDRRIAARAKSFVSTSSDK